ncbi:MAG TPA: pyruvate kinase, partial [Candidatus Acidoferrales bacterium]|nr:pyruvate kinase [Candidatus Acidoferrales bacterium]
MTPFRRTKIVATLGPSSCEPGMVKALVEAGVNVFRINMSHATHEQCELWTQEVRAAARSAQTIISVLADLQGPKLRIGELEGHRPIHLAAGKPFEITTAHIVGNPQRVATTYAALPKDVKPNDRI